MLRKDGPEMQAFLAAMRRIRDRCAALSTAQIQIEFREFNYRRSDTHWFGITEVCPRRWFQLRPKRNVLLVLIPYFSDNKDTKVAKKVSYVEVWSMTCPK